MMTGRTRFLLEIVFLIAVAGASAGFHWGPGAVAAAMGGAFVLVVVVEISSLQTERRGRPAQPRALTPSPPPEETWVDALERLGQHPASAPQGQAPTQRLTFPGRRQEPRAPRPAPAPEPGPRAPQLRPPRRREREPVPPPAISQPPPREAPPPVIVSEPPPRETAQPPPPRPVAPGPSLEPARAAVQPPISAPPAEAPATPVTAPPPPAEPAPSLEAPPTAAPPEPIRPAPTPVQWNLFELQSRARKIAGQDPARDEEWGFLFLYLREFAETDGLLSADFDSFVRESFPELLSGVA